MYLTFQTREIPKDLKALLKAESGATFRDKIYTSGFEFSGDPIKDLCLYGAPASLRALDSSLAEPPRLEKTVKLVCIDFDQTMNDAHVTDPLKKYKPEELQELRESNPTLMPQLLNPSGSKFEGGVFTGGVVGQILHLLRQPNTVIAVISYNPDPFALADFMKLVLKTARHDEEDAFLHRIIICSLPLRLTSEGKLRNGKSKGLQLFLVICYLMRHGVERITDCYLFDDSENNVIEFNYHKIIDEWKTHIKEEDRNQLSVGTFAKAQKLLPEADNIRGIHFDIEKGIGLDFSGLNIVIPETAHYIQESKLRRVQFLSMSKEEYAFRVDQQRRLSEAKVSGEHEYQNLQEAFAQTSPFASAAASLQGSPPRFAAAASLQRPPSPLAAAASLQRPPSPLTAAEGTIIKATQVDEVFYRDLYSSKCTELRDIEPMVQFRGGNDFIVYLAKRGITAKAIVVTFYFVMAPLSQNPSVFRTHKRQLKIDFNKGSKPSDFLSLKLHQHQLTEKKSLSGEYFIRDYFVFSGTSEIVIVKKSQSPSPSKIKIKEHYKSTVLALEDDNSRSVGTIKSITSSVSDRDVTKFTFKFLRDNIEQTVHMIPKLTT